MAAYFAAVITAIDESDASVKSLQHTIYIYIYMAAIAVIIAIIASVATLCSGRSEQPDYSTALVLVCSFPSLSPCGASTSNRS